MKCAIVYADGCRQIMLTAENEVEKQALKAMQTAKDEKARVCMTRGTFDDDLKPYGYTVSKCQGGYFRRFAESDSLMIEITNSGDKGNG